MIPSHLFIDYSAITVSAFLLKKGIFYLADLEIQFKL